MRLKGDRLGWGKTESLTANTNTPETDESLFEKFRSTGLEHYFTELYHRHSPAILTYLQKYLSNDDHAAEDVLQVTFIRVHQSHHQFDPSQKFRPWLFSIAANCAIDVKRTRGRRPACSLSEMRRDTGTDVIDFDPADTREAVAAEQVEKSEAAEALLTTLDQLPKVDRHIVQLIYFEGRSYPEAAAELGMPVGTVKSKVHRTLAMLRGLMGADSAMSEVA